MQVYIYFFIASNYLYLDEQANSWWKLRTNSKYL